MSHTRTTGQVENPQATNTTSNKYLSYFQANAQLAILKTVMVPVTQPIQVVMRQQQAALRKYKKVYSIRQSFHSITHSGGYPALWKGTVPAATKEFLKNLVYKGVVLSLTPSLVDPFVSKDRYPSLHAFSAASIGAALDTLIGGPFDSKATFAATSHGKDKQALFFEGMSKELSAYEKMKIVGNSLYRGALPTWGKTTVAMTTFYYMQEPVETSVLKLYNLDKNSEKPMSAKLLCAFGTGGAVAVFSSPLDIVKTIKQMPNPANQNLTKILVSNYKTFGFASFTTGLSLKFTQVVIGWGINDFVLKDVAPKSKKATHKPVSSAQSTLFKPAGKPSEPPIQEQPDQAPVSQKPN